MTEFEFTELVDRYLDRFENLDEKTKYNKERRLVKHLFPYLKDDIAFFNEQTIKHFVKNLREKGYKDSTIRVYLREIREFLEWTDSKGYLTARYDKKAEQTIFRGIKYKNLQKEEVKVYTDKELEIIDKFLTGQLDGIPRPPIYPILTGFLFHTGLRLAEALNVKLSDVQKETHIKKDEAFQLLLDPEIFQKVLEKKEEYEYLINPEKPLLSIKAFSPEKKEEILNDLISVLKENKKEKELKQVLKEVYHIEVREAKFGKQRITKMLLLDEYPVFKERFEGFLKYQQLRAKGEDVYLFSYEIKEGKRVIRRIERLRETTVKTAFSRYTRELKRLGYDIEIKAHTFRKTYASRLIEKGYSIEIVKELLGHENIGTTSRYYLNAKKIIDELY